MGNIFNIKKKKMCPIANFVMKVAPMLMTAVFDLLGCNMEFNCMEGTLNYYGMEIMLAAHDMKEEWHQIFKHLGLKHIIHRLHHIGFYANPMNWEYLVGHAIDHASRGVADFLDTDRQTVYLVSASAIMSVLQVVMGLVIAGLAYAEMSIGQVNFDYISYLLEKSI